MQPSILLLTSFLALASAAPNPQATEEPPQATRAPDEIDWAVLTDFGAFTSFIDSLFPGVLDAFTALPADISFNPGEFYSSILSDLGLDQSDATITDVPSFTLDDEDATFTPTKTIFDTFEYTGSNGGNLITFSEDIVLPTADATGRTLAGNTRTNVFTNTGVATVMTGSFTGDEAGASATETGNSAASKGKVVDVMLAGCCAVVAGVVVVL